MGVATPRPWRSLLTETALTLGAPLLEVDEPERTGVAPAAVVAFVDAAAADRGVTRRVRAAWPGVPLLVLLRGGGDRALLGAMEMGADDVLPLPATAAELAERVRATVRRVREEEDAPPLAPAVQAAGLVVDVTARRFRRGDRAVPLTHAEVRLLAAMVGSAGRALSRERLLNQLCGFDYEIDSRVIDVHVRNLRRKVEIDPAHPEVIQAVPGVGYCVPLALD